MKTCFLPVLFAVFFISASSDAFAGRKAEIENPDFTKGGKIPEEATHDWNLGATGARGWMYPERLETSKARQIAITKVNKATPADGVLKVGDVILGIAGKRFAYDPRIELGKALTAAEAETGELKLICWRDGKQSDVVVKLPVLGAYSPTAPYNCPKSKRILEQGCEALAKRMGSSSYKEGIIPRCWNALALLASGDAKYLPLIKKEAEWASSFSAESMATWYYGYVITLLAEYQLATGDDAYAPDMKRLALEAARGQSIVGSWGHKFAGEEGRLVGYGMMNAPGLPLTTSLVLARMAGLKAPEIDLAIDRSAKMLRFYAGKGAVPYGDHAPWIQTHEDNGKCGMAAYLFHLLGEKNVAEYFSRMSLAAHGPSRDTGHTGNYWNISWAMPSIALSGPDATGAWMHEFGAWYFDLGRDADGGFRHQGPPEVKPDKTGNWDGTGHYLVAYALPLKKIMLTGKTESTIPQLSVGEASAIIDDGRGWSNMDRTSYYDQLKTPELLKRLGSWSPVVRELAAMALARRDDLQLQDLLKLLSLDDLNFSLGVCQAVAQLKEKAAPAAPLMIERLKSNDLWLRVKAAEALGAMGPAGMPAVPQLLEIIAAGPTESDPRGMEQRYLNDVVFTKMLKNSLAGVDQQLLQKAVVAGLQNQDGRSRGNVARIYSQLSYDQIKPLLPAIRDAIVYPSPSGIMFADGVRIQGLTVFAKHRIKEGIPLCVSFFDVDRWNKKSRIDSCLKVLASYGSAAKPVLPELRRLEKDLTGHREAKNLQETIDTLRQLIQDIESGKSAPELRTMD